jgi:seryl-tRNA synthetase
MRSKQNARSLVVRAFPGHEAAIDRALRDDASFRELCEDYRKCAAARNRWQRLTGDGPASRSREYDELLGELGNELEAWLEDLEKAQDRPLVGESA